MKIGSQLGVEVLVGSGLGVGVVATVPHLGSCPCPPAGSTLGTLVFFVVLLVFSAGLENRLIAGLVCGGKEPLTLALTGTLTLTLNHQVHQFTQH